MTSVKNDKRIIIFCCNWCSYAGADLAGVGRLQMKPDFRVIRTMCSARIDPQLVLEAFAKGADGVMIAGCHPGDCHYIGGNYKTRRRFHILRRMLEQLGINPQRLELQWVSASESKQFQEVVNSFCEKIAAMDKLQIPSAKKVSQGVAT
ncbi:MAG TPA: hydrogenase iron-sulfur subunit [Candidatus Sumerlaeota bacterium]|nr:hydrogenase iron-sulfur subunit [Candidatus Sumerlaeota bacterium]HRR29708.1 hydrogenase iron-sulfur subunit [Candidatus Sumerlaeia bacterium]HON50376.1 hydrogenase iron-sulfur subunit [Candidatus Sumerlaeota bacterium]HOR63592.1 hydrogenase iron-sulfur subunit [Candidatus Sumerlaeota bacterium]HPL73558.1 hydrogenase iron-sulfur subunit [Candidatus Sumerlaeota bacterium]